MNFNSVFEELNKLYENKEEPAKKVLPAEKEETTEEPVEEGCNKKALKEDWYGADTEVEFDESVYDDIAKYFGLAENDKVYYAYYFLDEVTVNYTDAKGQDHEIEKHVPIDQVEEWFKAGYYITEAAKKALKEADEEAPEEIPEETTDTVEDFVKSFDEYDGKLKLEFKPIVIDGKEYPVTGILWDDSEEGKLVAEVIFDMPEEEPVAEEIPEEEVVEENFEKDGELEEILDIKPSINLSLDGGQGNDVDVL
jgi:hypothetical protein